MSDGERLRLIATNLRCNGECADGDFVDYCAGRLNKQDAELVTRVAELEAALAHLVGAARKVARWANPGDEVCSPESDVMAREADELRAILAELEAT